MLEYQKIFDTFDLKEFEDSVFSGKEHGWNAAYECCDRWVNSNKIALNWISSKSEFEKLSYRSLEVKSKQFANMLIQKGIKNGDVVAGLLPRIPELLVVIVGTWRIGAVYQPLFTAFGPKAIETRVSKKTGSNAKIILTDSINKSKLDDLPNCPLIIEIDRSKDSEENFNKKLIKQKTDLKTVSLTRIDPFTTLFTSGTTGNPKGVVYPNEMLTAIAAYMIYGIGLRKTDSYWCMADPGWAYGLLYAVIGPLLLGATTTMYEGGFTTESTLSVIEKL
nr:AMP-binding protein [Paracoccaceae bacterium]